MVVIKIRLCSVVYLRPTVAQGSLIGGKRLSSEELQMFAACMTVSV